MRGSFAKYVGSRRGPSEVLGEVEVESWRPRRGPRRGDGCGDGG